MIDIPILFQFMIILCTHYVADYVLQTHWQATNKSRNNDALLEHVGVYTVVLAVVTGPLFGFGAMWFAFVWINAVLHFCTDYATSRWSARLFKPALDDTCRVLVFTQTYRREPTAGELVRMDVNPGRHWHNFHGVLGFDQLIHQISLGVTLSLIVA